MSPLVSIVIPTRNRAALLKKAIGSALAQTYPAIEIVVVDDGSTDETPEVVRGFDARIVYLRGSGLGCAGAKNAGLAAASGSLITNLDDDDLFLPEKVERQARVFERRPEVGLCATGALFIDERERVLGRQVPPSLPGATRLLHLLRACPFVQSSVMLRRECHDRLGPYSLTVAEDYDFWLRASLWYEFAAVPEPLTMHRRHRAQMTSPENNASHMDAVRSILARFLRDLPAERICPRLATEDVHAALGAILMERKFFAEAESHLARSLPGRDGLFWWAMLALRKGDRETAAEALARLSPESLLKCHAAQLQQALATGDLGRRGVSRLFKGALETYLASLESLCSTP